MANKMVNGGIFQLLTNDGKQDRLILASALLTKRMVQIEQYRKKMQMPDPTPTLVDIEKTHVLFTNAHFKPFVAMAYEYQQIRPTGTAAFGQSGIQFSIPQFGDFFNDMVLRVTIDAVTAPNSEYWDDPAESPSIGSELIRYVDFPGHRLISKTKMKVNGNNLDEYNTDTVNFHYKFRVQPGKEYGWRSMLGQENPVPAVVGTTASTASSTLMRGSGVRQAVDLLNGPQTPKVQQPALELYYPLLFWFNLDPRLAIPSVCIPYGQRYIEFDTVDVNRVLQPCHAYDPLRDGLSANLGSLDARINQFQLWINNIFVQPEIHDIYIRRIAFSLIRVNLTQENAIQSELQQLLSNFKYPIETIYFAYQFTSQINPNNNPNYATDWFIYGQPLHETVELCSLANSYGFSDAIAGITPVIPEIQAAFVPNAFGVTIDFAESAISLGYTTAPDAATATLTWEQINTILIFNKFVPLVIPPGTNLSTVISGDELISSSPPLNCTAVTTECSPNLSTVKFTAQSIDLYPDTPQKFYNSYLPYIRGGTNIVTPKDCGAYQVTFNLYPGSYQPSGHINVSRSREFYISPIVAEGKSFNSNTPGRMIACAVAINFLLISDGSAVLRYGT